MNKTKVTLLLCSLWLALCWSAGHLLAYRDLETGTFLTPDPAGMVDGPNVYAYVRQNPWTHFDPEGLYLDRDGPNTAREDAGRIISGGTDYNVMETAYINVTSGHGNAGDVQLLGKAVQAQGSVALTLIRNGIEQPAAAEKIAMALGAGVAAVSDQSAAKEMAIVPGKGQPWKGQAGAELPISKPTTTEGPGGKSARVISNENGAPGYSSIPDPKNVKVGGEFTDKQRVKALDLNRETNGGEVRSDGDGRILQKPQKSRKGVTPHPDEWQFDHKEPKDKGGTNASSNLQILSREENRAKSNN